MHTTAGAGTEKNWASFRLPSLHHAAHPHRQALHSGPSVPWRDGSAQSPLHTPYTCTQWRTHIGGSEYFVRTLKQTCSQDCPRAPLAFKDSMTHVFCNSHYVSHFAAFFIDVGAKISSVTSFILGFSNSFGCFRLWVLDEMVVSARFRTAARVHNAAHTARNHRKSHTHT
jgi:hypothetical protein